MFDNYDEVTTQLIWSYFVVVSVVVVIISFVFVRGLILGTSVCIVSYIGDNTISYKSAKKIKEENYDLYVDAINSLIINMIVISPIVYSINDL